MVSGQTVGPDTGFRSIFLLCSLACSFYKATRIHADCHGELSQLPVIQRYPVDVFNKVKVSAICCGIAHNKICVSYWRCKVIVAEVNGTTGPLGSVPSWMSNLFGKSQLKFAERRGSIDPDPLPHSVPLSENLYFVPLLYIASTWQRIVTFHIVNMLLGLFTTKGTINGRFWSVPLPTSIVALVSCHLSTTYPPPAAAEPRAARPTSTSANNRAIRLPVDRGGGDWGGPWCGPACDRGFAAIERRPDFVTSFAPWIV